MVTVTVIYPWRHHTDGSTHIARCSACDGAEITRWVAPPGDSPPPKHRALIDQHIAGHDQ